MVSSAAKHPCRVYTITTVLKEQVFLSPVEGLPPAAGKYGQIRDDYLIGSDKLQPDFAFLSPNRLQCPPPPRLPDPVALPLSRQSTGFIHPLAVAGLAH
jgi:hypothetical protein